MVKFYLWRIFYFKLLVGYYLLDEDILNEFYCLKEGKFKKFCFFDMVNIKKSRIKWNKIC